MAKNIEMNYKDESGYEILRPQTTCEMVIDLLNEDTKQLMGLSPSDQADDAFRKIYLAQVLDGRALINFTVMGDDGTPCKGVQIESSQFCDSTGNKEPVIETNDEGKVSIFVDNTSVQAKINYYGDLGDWNDTYSIEFGQQYDKTITLTRYKFKKYTSSGSVKFSGDIVNISFSLGAAGAGGCYYDDGGSYFPSGAGGGGGYVEKRESISIIKNNYYDYTIGSGGNGSKNNGSLGDVGGSSTFIKVNATGGSPPSVYYYNTQPAGRLGGSGNGQGGNGAIDYPSRTYETAGENGTQTYYTSFTEESLYGGGGGGGRAYRGGTNMSGIRGGNPGGGAGGGTTYSSSDSSYGDGANGMTNLGGGGGGGGVWYRDIDSAARGYHCGSGGKGGSGVLTIRMYRQQDLST